MKEGISLLENADLIKDLRKRNRGMGEALRESRHVFCFLMFIGLYTALLLSTPFAEFNHFQKSVRDRFDRLEGDTRAEQRLMLRNVGSVFCSMRSVAGQGMGHFIQSCRCRPLA